MSSTDVTNPPPPDNATVTGGRLARIFPAYVVIETGMAGLRGLLFNLLFIMAFAVVVPLVAVEMFRERVTIEPIGVPPGMSELGYTSDVVANRLWDAVQQVNVEARTAKERLSILPSSRRVEFAFPDSGLSFESTIYHVRRFFNAYETRIGGEFVCAASPCTRDRLRLRIRLLRAGMDVIELPPMGTASDDDYFKQAAAQVLRHIDPFVAASWAYERDPDHALADLRRLVRSKHVDSKWALNLIGNIMSDRKLYDEAIANYQAALKLDPRYTIAMINLARVTSDKGDQQAAIGLARKAIIAGADVSSAQVVIGRAEAELGNVDAAAEAYRKAAEADPNSPWPEWRLGYLLSRSGDSAGSKQAYARAIEIDPDFIEARNGLALLAMLEGDYPGLLAQYREIQRLRPGDAGAIADVASALAMNKDYEAAIATYREALKLKPGVAKWLNDLGQLVRDRGQLAEAEKLFEEAIAADQTLTVARFNLGDVYQRQGKKDEARAALTEYLRLAPDEPYAVLARAWLAKLDQP